MNIITKGKKTFMQSYNPMNIEVVEKKNNQIVHRFYSSPEMMSASDRAAYIINAMNSCDEDCMSPEQIAVARQCVKAMMIQQALAKNCR